MSRKAGKRVGILGGSFDPVHNGHIGLATQVREKFHLDHILFMPTYISPHKQDRGPVSPHHRLAMLRLAVAPHPFFLISEMELNRKEVSFTVDTLSNLTEKQPDTEFFLIMGKDTFAGIKTWKAVHRLFGMSHVIVATRPGYTLEGDIMVFRHREKATKLNFFDLIPMDVSSSDIRERINSHRDIKNMLPPEVENYIIDNQLYSTKSYP